MLAGVFFAAGCQDTSDDPVGRSFPVHVPNDAGRDPLLAPILADARAHRLTKVLLQGRLFTFEAPSNARSHTGLYIEVPTSQAIGFAALGG